MSGCAYGNNSPFNLERGLGQGRSGMVSFVLLLRLANPSRLTFVGVTAPQVRVRLTLIATVTLILVIHLQGRAVIIIHASIHL